MSEPAPIKFPGPKPPPPATLPLRRRSSLTRSPFEVSEASAAARESIKAIVSATRAPFPSAAGAESARVGELERTLLQLAMTLAERERVLHENESRLADRERDLAEMEALLLAREKLLVA